MIIIKDKEQFNREVLQALQPVMVDFYADWCGPCKALAPMMEKLDEDADGYSIAKVDVDALPELAQAYRVSSIPTVLVFRGGECTARNVGLVSREDLEKLL